MFQRPVQRHAAWIGIALIVLNALAPLVSQWRHPQDEVAAALLASWCSAGVADDAGEGLRSSALAAQMLAAAADDAPGDPPHGGSVLQPHCPFCLFAPAALALPSTPATLGGSSATTAPPSPPRAWTGATPARYPALWSRAPPLLA